MAISQRLKNALKCAFTDPGATKEIATILGASGGVTKQAAITAITITPTSGSLPTPGGSTTVANTGTPTVVELLDLCVELNAKIDAIRSTLTAAGVTL